MYRNDFNLTRIPMDYQNSKYTTLTWVREEEAMRTIMWGNVSNLSSYFGISSCKRYSQNSLFLADMNNSIIWVTSYYDMFLQVLLWTRGSWCVCTGTRRAHEWYSTTLSTDSWQHGICISIWLYQHYHLILKTLLEWWFCNRMHQWKAHITLWTTWVRMRQNI